MNREVVLSCENLSVGYSKAVISGVGLQVHTGQFVALLGPNGAGKTTLLRTLSRHQSPVSGRVRILGQDLQQMKALDLARVMAVGLTDPARPPLLSSFEFAALGRYPHTGFMGKLSQQDVDVVMSALAAVAADGLADRPVDQLSDGERQKVVLARALAQEPRVLLLDEPTAHLDLKHRVEVMGILRNLCRSRGLAVLASLHDVDIAAKVADRVYMVKAGQVVDEGLPEQVLTSRAVSTLYDFDAADFSRDLGGIELRGDGTSGRVFVTAGLGRGAAVFRFLAKRSHTISTGILPEGDLDTFVGQALGAQVFAQCHGKTCEALLQEAVAALDDCALVIDSGPQKGDMAQLNRQILDAAEKRGLPVMPFEISQDLPRLGDVIRTCLSAVSGPQ